MLWVTVKYYISLPQFFVQTQRPFADVALRSGRGPLAVARHDGKTPTEICVGSLRVVPNLLEEPSQQSPAAHV